MSRRPDVRSVVTVAASASGQAEVHKRSASPDGRERLRRQAAVLRHGRHPGVVDLVALRSDEDGATVLVTRLAGAQTLATWTPPTLDELAGLLVALAETLADLHHLGLGHGAVEADHVVLDPAGRPVLCGFTGDRDHRRADDVAALARLTRQLVEAIGSAADEAPLRRGSRRQAAARRRLLQLADQTVDADPATRPGARRFAAAVLTAVPTAVLTPPAPEPRRRPVGPAPADRDEDTHVHVDPDAIHGPEQSADPALDVDAADVDPGIRVVTDTAIDTELAPPRRGAVTAVAVIGLALVVFGALSAWTGERPELRTSVAAPAPPPRTADPAGTDTATDDAATHTAATGTAAAGASSDLGGPTDPASCAPGTCSAVRPGGVITQGSTRFALGDPTDELVVADPRCPTAPAIALLRPSDGATFLFDRWAAPGQDVAPRSGPVVQPGSHWVARPLDADGCAELVVRGPTGEVAPFDPTPPAAAPPTDDPNGTVP